ncbi:MAG: three-Cys-motif partner protein TcmP [Myxococcales bacterium]|nr:three-Cys-motif partner protein TcmP [Myxococcales bacterium]
MNESYEGREQSAAKHEILRTYLQRLAYKVGLSSPGVTLNYVDAFAGPWQSKLADLSDTSPAIALRTLLDVQADLRKHQRDVHVRAFFVSREAAGVSQLASLRERFPGADIVVVESEFEGALDRARRFLREGPNPFGFVFIDNTGWTGFGLRAITPLLREGRNEVLINFMTDYIKRFANEDDALYSASIDRLYGDASCRNEWRGLTGAEREDQMLATYCRCVRNAGSYRHCISTVVLKPTEDRTYFHLVYGTNSDEGLVTFRDVEKRGIEFQRRERAEAKQRKRVARTGVGELFPATASTPPRTYEDALRERYVARAYELLDALLVTRPVVAWDEMVLAALQVPMVHEGHVKEWLRRRVELNTVVVEGLSERDRVPKRKHGHRVRRL